MTQEERKLCAFQAKVFESSVEESNDSSAVFIRRFMRSELAKRLDRDDFALDILNPGAVVHDIDSSYKSDGYGSEKFSRNEMHWIGYFYRCFCNLTGMTSKEAYRFIGSRELRKLYYPYHSLEVEQAVERVLEAKGSNNSTQVQRGVQILKTIRGVA